MVNHHCPHIVHIKVARLCHFHLWCYEKWSYVARMWSSCTVKHGHLKVMAGSNRRGLRIPRGLKATVPLVMGLSKVHVVSFHAQETSTNAATDFMHSLPDSLQPFKIMSRHVESNHTSTACQRARSPRRPSHLKSHPWQQKCVNHQNQHVRPQVEH